MKENETKTDNLTIEKLLHLCSMLYKTRDEISEINLIIADNYPVGDKISQVSKRAYETIEMLRSELDTQMAESYPCFAKQISEGEKGSYYE